MKKSLSILFVFGLILSINAQSSYCLKLSEISNDGQYVTMKIEMQGNESFKLGTSNLQFDFSEEVLGEPVLEESIMTPPVYFVPTVTMPFEDICSFNIELSFPEMGMNIAGYPNWTELGQVKFVVLNPNASYEFNWAYNGGTTETVAFLDDEATLFYATNEDCLIVEGVDGVEEVSFLEGLSIYPNPTSDELNITYTIEGSNEMKYEIYDAASRVLKKGVFNGAAGDQKSTIDVSDFSAGQYVITFTVKEEVHTERFDVLR